MNSNLSFPIPNSELPQGWHWVKLGEVCKINPRRPEKFTRFKDALTTFIPMAAVEEKTGTIINPEIVPYSKIAKGYTYFQENDVLFAKITPCMQNGKHVIARNLIDGIGFGTTEFHVLRPGIESLSEWIWYFIRQRGFLEEAKSYFTGAVGQQRVPESFLSNYIIPLPPLLEQKRIATRIQESLQEVKHARTACEKQLEAAKALPTAYLREVFESEEAKKWERKRVGEVAEKFVNGGTPNTSVPNYWNGNIPWITGADITSLWVSSGRKLITDEGLNNSATHLVKENTVLIVTRTGVGKVGIAANDLCFSQDITGVICGRKILPEFLARFLVFQEDILVKAQRGSTIKGLTRDDIETIDILVPPLYFQERIISQLKEKMAQIENLQSATQTQQDALNSFPQAILRQAFNGEL